MIKLPTNMKNKIDNSDLVESKLYDYWNENTETLCGYATARLFGQKVEYETLKSVLSEKNYNKIVGDLDNPNTTGKFKSTLRLTLGYNLLTPTLTQAKIGLYSDKALKLRLSDPKWDDYVTDDHVFGTTEVGLQTFLNYKNSGWDMKYMLNEWLPQHLYLWLQIRILKSEHQGDGSVKRGKHTLEEKTSLVHYDEANISQIKVLS